MTTTGDYSSVMLSLSPEGFLAGIAAGPLAITPQVEKWNTGHRNLTANGKSG